MPVARIVTRNLDRESPALRQLTERLQSAGYDVEFASSTGGQPPDLLLEVEQMPNEAAVDAALDSARQTDADVFVAAGLFGGEEARQETKVQSADPAPSVSEPNPEDAAPADAHVDGPAADAPGEHETSMAAEIGDETSSDAGESRRGLADSIADLRARAGQAWSQMQLRRAESAEARHLERERLQRERAERHRLEQLELQRRADEQQRVRAERERAAAEQQRILREQMAREAAAMAERQRVEQAETAERERERLAVVEAERLHAARVHEIQRATALAEQRARLERQAELRPVAPKVAVPQSTPRAAVQASAMAAPVRKAAPAPKPARARQPRATPSARERQWQRAALIASLATLAAMLGFGLAAGFHTASPLPASLTGDHVEQKVPFGPGGTSAAGSAGAVAPASSDTGLAKQGMMVAKQAAPKPSPAKTAPARPSQGPRRGRTSGAKDEVTVRHFPNTHLTNSHAERAQTTNDGVRHYSDQN